MPGGYYTQISGELIRADAPCCLAAAVKSETACCYRLGLGAPPYPPKPPNRMGQQVAGLPRERTVID